MQAFQLASCKSRSCRPRSSSPWFLFTPVSARERVMALSPPHPLIYFPLVFNLRFPPSSLSLFLFLPLLAHDSDANGGCDVPIYAPVLRRLFIDPRFTSCQRRSSPAGSLIKDSVAVTLNLRPRIRTAARRRRCFSTLDPRTRRVNERRPVGWFCAAINTYPTIVGPT